VGFLLRGTYGFQRSRPEEDINARKGGDPMGIDRGVSSKSFLWEKRDLGIGNKPVRVGLLLRADLREPMLKLGAETANQVPKKDEGPKTKRNEAGRSARNEKEGNRKRPSSA